jgi:glutamine amidotransferase
MGHTGSISIVDYGSGNLRSVQKAFERLGVVASIASRPEEMESAEIVVLPGVGAFGDAMRELSLRGFVDPIRRHLASDRPFLGICMGLQLLFDRGLEGGQHAGLGVLRGEVVRFGDGTGLKVPHMGWNRVAWTPPSGPAVDGGREGDGYFYFVHSYHALPADPSVVLGTTEYGGSFCSAVRRGRLVATQFHPEKSQSAGMRFLGWFLGHVAGRQG